MKNARSNKNTTTRSIYWEKYSAYFFKNIIDEDIEGIWLLSIVGNLYKNKKKERRMTNLILSKKLEK